MQSSGLTVVWELFAVLLGCLACSGDHTWLQDDDADAGRLRFGLRKAAASEVDVVSVVLTAPDDSTSEYQIDVTGADAASISLGGLEAGVYSVSFTATTRQGHPCAGSAQFEIEPAVDTFVHVEIVCDLG